VDAQFRYAFPDGLDVSRISGSQALNPGLYSGTRQVVAQGVEPLSKYIGLANFDHGRL